MGGKISEISSDLYIPWRGVKRPVQMQNDVAAIPAVGTSAGRWPVTAARPLPRVASRCRWVGPALPAPKLGRIVIADSGPVRFPGSQRQSEQRAVAPPALSLTRPCHGRRVFAPECHAVLIEVLMIPIEENLVSGIYPAHGLG
jgi:hypothetical protein